MGITGNNRIRCGLVVIVVVVVCKYPWGYEGQSNSGNHEGDDSSGLKKIH